jgi:hypothetical protein
VGEAFKRNRAAQFQHQSHRAFQKLISRDLLRISRGEEIRFELNARLANNTTGLAVGSHCIVLENGGSHDVIHGNIVIARVPAEATEMLAACKQVAPNLNGVFPCRVTRLSAFGGVSLELEPGNDNNA